MTPNPRPENSLATKVITGVKAVPPTQPPVASPSLAADVLSRLTVKLPSSPAFPPRGVPIAGCPEDQVG